MKRVLLLHGGWEGHDPQGAADFVARELLEGFDVVRAQDLGMLRADVLKDFDLLIPVWTFGEITREQEKDLTDAVATGLGLIGWHGAASAFLASRAHKFLLGGQFVAHPGGSATPYDVKFVRGDALVEGLADFAITTEQYYMLVDPAVKVLATTRMKLPAMPWLDDVEMPVAWTRDWGRGRVFYCSLGHDASILQHATISELLRRAIRWAGRQ